MSASLAKRFVIISLTVAGSCTTLNSSHRFRPPLDQSGELAFCASLLLPSDPILKLDHHQRPSDPTFFSLRLTHFNCRQQTQVQESSKDEKTEFIHQRCQAFSSRLCRSRCFCCRQQQQHRVAQHSSLHTTENKQHHRQPRLERHHSCLRLEGPGDCAPGSIASRCRIEPRHA